MWRFICAALDWSLEVGAECMGLCGEEADGWYFDRKLCYRAGADRVRTGDGYRGLLEAWEKSLQELGGLLLISDAGGFWGTEWDDQRSGRRIPRVEEKETESRKETEKTGTEYQKAAEKTGREREEKEEENQKDGTLPEVQENQKESDRIMTVEEIQEDVLKTSETGNSYQAPQSASAGATATRPVITASAGTTTTRPAVTASAGTTTARPAVTAFAETIATGAISSTSGNTL